MKLFVENPFQLGEYIFIYKKKCFILNFEKLEEKKGVQIYGNRGDFDDDPGITKSL